MQIERRACIYDATVQDSSENVAFFDGLLPLASGTWLSGFTAGRKKHHPQAGIRVARSRDAGTTWTTLPWRFESVIAGVPGSLCGAEMVEVGTPAGGRRILLATTWFDRSEPDRPLFDPQTEGILHSRQLTFVSTDEGDGWSDARAVETPGLNGCSITGPMLQWPDGTIALAFESFKEFDDPAPARHGAWLLLSRDGGESFEPPRSVAHDPGGRIYYWDQRLCTGPGPGDFYGLFWTHDRQQKRDLNVHFLSGNIYDDSRAQNAPVETTIPGQIAAPLAMDDGRLFAFVVDRAPPGTMRLWQSADRGRTWPEQTSLLVHRHDERAELSQGQGDVDFAEYWEDMGKWSFGHPAIRGASDGRLILSWYAGTPECMSVHAAVVRVDD